MIASEKFSLVSLIHKCMCFRSTCASASAVIATWDAVRLKSSLRARVIHSDIHKLLHAVLGTGLSGKGIDKHSMGTKFSLMLLDMCVRLCVCECVCARVLVYNMSFLSLLRRVNTKGTRVKSWALSGVYFFSSHVFPNMTKFNSHSPDFYTRKWKLRNVCYTAMSVKDSWQAPVTSQWQR